MSDKLASLTEVTKEDVDTAVSNFKQQKALDSAEYQKRLREWRDSYKFSWWQRKVKKLDSLDAKELLTKLYGTDSMMGFRYDPTNSIKIKMGLWDFDFNYTLGSYGETWRKIATRLYLSRKESHLVCSGVLDWIISWRDHTIEGGENE